MRDTDCVARLGGDEFAILQASVDGTEDVVGPLRADHPDGGAALRLLGDSAFVGVSIGVAIAPEAGVDRAELMRKADIALYRAKSRAATASASSPRRWTSSSSAAAQIEAELREALACRRPAPARLPAALLPTTPGALVGVEALLRWNHPSTA